MQVLRVLDRRNGDSGRTELPYALRRPQRPAAPQMDALGLARHLAVSDVQVRAASITPFHQAAGGTERVQWYGHCGRLSWLLLSVA